MGQCSGFSRESPGRPPSCCWSPNAVVDSIVKDKTFAVSGNANDNFTFRHSFAVPVVSGPCLIYQKIVKYDESVDCMHQNSTLQSSNKTLFTVFSFLSGSLLEAYNPECSPVFPSQGPCISYAIINMKSIYLYRKQLNIKYITCILRISDIFYIVSSVFSYMAIWGTL